ncbi:MAG: AmmeMemoRadiSam system radical SAM enzyme [Chitinivibrionales bacterium]|nr:AmmeMemoRadiSam system radical SAM enzyme [Chitinivibrionales bacterium]
MDHEAMLYEKQDGSLTQCFLCAHNCLIKPGKYGFCEMRQNISGDLITYAYGEVIARDIDPIEKKTMYHFLPATKTASIAAQGNNFKCTYCQSLESSLHGEHNGEIAGTPLTPEAVVRHAKRNGCKSITYTYTEPTIFFEYAFDIARMASRRNLKNIFVTNGYMTTPALDTIAPFLDACNVDLKSFRDDFYRKVCSAKLQPVLDSIAHMRKLGLWLEISTVIIPEQNDSEEEIKDIARFIAGISEDIPWHVNRFYPDYNAMDVQPTSLHALERAQQIGREAGLKYVYIGNALVASNTLCPNCNTLLIKREGDTVVENNIHNSSCPSCNHEIAGVWGQEIAVHQPVGSNATE